MFQYIKIRLTVCEIALITCFIVMGCSSENQVKPLKPLHVGTGNWEPFVGQSLPHYGPVAEMLTNILVDLEYVPEFKFYDWPMVEIHLAAGYPSIAFPFIESKERKKKGFRFSDPLLEFDYVLFFHKKRLREALSLQSLDELMKLDGRIGLIRGYAKLAETPDKAYKEVSSTIAGFNQLRDGEGIYYLLESKIVGLRLLEGRYLPDDKNDFMFLGQSNMQTSQENLSFINKVALRIMLSPKLNPDIINDINDKIKSNKKKPFFHNLENQIMSGNKSSETGYLVSGNHETIYGYLSESDNSQMFALPGKSKVLVIKWGSAYLREIKKTREEIKGGRSKVKLLNGPLRGKVMWVNNRFITLER